MGGAWRMTPNARRRLAAMSSGPARVSVAALGDVAGAHLARAPRDDRLHAADCAVFGDVGLEHLVNLAILVLVLDLSAAQLHAHVRLAARNAGRLAKASTAVAQRQVARRRGAGVEVLVEPVVWRHHHCARPPIALLHLIITIAPEHAEAVPIQDDHVRPGSVAMRLLIGTDLELV